jgi:hypothetical protein
MREILVKDRIGKPMNRQGGNGRVGEKGRLRMDGGGNVWCSMYVVREAGRGGVIVRGGTNDSHKNAWRIPCMREAYTSSKRHAHKRACIVQCMREK